MSEARLTISLTIPEFGAMLVLMKSGTMFARIETIKHAQNVLDRVNKKLKKEGCNPEQVDRITKL